MIQGGSLSIREGPAEIADKQGRRQCVAISVVADSPTPVDRDKALNILIQFPQDFRTTGRRRSRTCVVRFVRLA